MRDQAVEAVHQKLVGIRPIVVSLFGLKRAVELVPVDGSTALEPELLWRQAEHTLSRLRAPDLQLPATSTKSVTFDPLQFANELEPLVTALRAAIDAVDLDRRQAEASVEVKRREMADHDLIVRACGRILSGFYLLAGRPDLAERMRTTLSGRRRQKPQDDTVSSSDSAASQAGSEPAADAASGTGEPASEPATT